MPDDLLTTPPPAEPPPGDTGDKGDVGSPPVLPAEGGDEPKVGPPAEPPPKYGDLETVEKRYAGAQRKITEQAEEVKARDAKIAQLEGVVQQFIGGQGIPGRPAPEADPERIAKSVVQKFGLDESQVPIITSIAEGIMDTTKKEISGRHAQNLADRAWDRFESGHPNEKFTPEDRKRLDTFLTKSSYVAIDPETGMIRENPYQDAHDYLKYREEQTERTRLTKEKQAEIERQKKEAEAQKKTVATQPGGSKGDKLTPEELERKRAFGLTEDSSDSRTFYSG